MLTIQEVTQVPEGASDGFQVVQDKTGEVVLFFHWQRDPEQPGTRFEDVLVALPDRLAELGHEQDTARLTGEVHRRFARRQIQ